MKAVVWRGDNKVSYENYPDPVVNKGYVKLRVSTCGFCVTDYHIIKGNLKICKPPHVLGHEICGTVVETGEGADKGLMGKRVVVETYVGCGECEFCKSGRSHLCSAGEIGYPPYQGGEAEYVCVPAHCVHVLPDCISDDEGGIMEAVVCPVGALMNNDLSKCETLLVLGAGAAGLSFIQGAKAFGVKKVICVIRNDEKKRQALYFGADAVIDTRTENLKERLLQETSGAGADMIAEATGSAELIEECFDLVKKGGKIILYGLPDEKAVIKMPVTKIILDEISLCGYTGNSKAWDKVISLVAEKKINLKDMVTMTLPLKDAYKAVEITDGKPPELIKIALKPQRS